MKQLEIVRKDLAPLQLKLFAVLIVLATNFKILTFTFDEVNPIVFIVGNLIAFVIWTAKDIMIIDFENNTIGEGFKIVGLKYIDKTKFSEVEKIFINSVSLAQTFRHLNLTKDIHYHNYKAFLKTSEGDKFWIGINSDKDMLIKQLKEYNKVIKTEVFDTTEQEQIKID